MSSATIDVPFLNRNLWYRSGKRKFGTQRCSDKTICCKSGILLKHSGKAVVFENIEDYHARIDDPELDIDQDSIMVLKNVAPKGIPRYGRSRQYVLA